MMIERQNQKDIGKEEDKEKEEELGPKEVATPDIPFGKDRYTKLVQPARIIRIIFAIFVH